MSGRMIGAWIKSGRERFRMCQDKAVRNIGEGGVGNPQRVAKRMKLKAFEEKYRSEEPDMKEMEQYLYGWLGHAEYGDTYGLRKKLLDGFILTRGDGE